MLLTMPAASYRHRLDACVPGPLSDMLRGLPEMDSILLLTIRHPFGRTSVQR